MIEASAGQAFVKWFPIWFPVLSVMVGIVGAWGINRVVNRKLYNADGTLIYLTRENHEKHKGVCMDSYCRKIDKLTNDVRDNKNEVIDMFREVKQALHDADEKREQARDDFVKMAIKVARIEGQGKSQGGTT